MKKILRQISESGIANKTNSLVRVIALQYYYANHVPDARKQVRFYDKWIRQFRSRHNFSRRKAHKKTGSNKGFF